MKLKDEQLLWELIDLDDTIANNSGYPDYELTTPIEDAKWAMEQITNAGRKVILFTARPWGEHETIESWLNKYEIPFRRIICAKTLGRHIIDNSARQFKNNWREIIEEIL